MNLVPVPAAEIFTDKNFADKALAIFRFQAEKNPVYREFLQYLDIQHASITNYRDIPFLPVELFRDREVVAGDGKPEIIFESSGTTATRKSRHLITEISLYRESFLKCFTLFYGDIKNYCLLALLPSYLENENSSLIYMCNELIDASGNKGSGFFMHDHDTLINIMKRNEENKQKTLLLGVSYALLDLAEKFSFPLQHTILMETGGMKGKRKEMTREELHEILKKSFSADAIHSEYGMTELLSQAYSNGNGRFFTPSWMKILIRDTEDPFHFLREGKSGLINIIDLANINSCSFIATQDIGKISEDGSFEVLGRYDKSDVRGCNLMADTG